MAEVLCVRWVAINEINIVFSQTYHNTSVRLTDSQVGKVKDEYSRHGNTPPNGGLEGGKSDW